MSGLDPRREAVRQAIGYAWSEDMVSTFADAALDALRPQLDAADALANAFLNGDLSACGPLVDEYLAARDAGKADQ